MIELSHKNHFQFGYDGRPFISRAHPNENWWVSYGRCQRPVGTWADECVHTAQLILDAAEGEPIWILFSGGIDSEIALRSFLQAKIRIQVAILRFKNELNSHDIAHAIAFCESHDISHRIFDLDIHDFFESGRAFEYAEATQCGSPQFLAPMWCIDQLDGYPVMGSGECYLVKRNEFGKTYRTHAGSFSSIEVLEGDENSWDLWEKELVASWYRHFLFRNRKGCPGFFQFNPENMLAFLRDPGIQALTENRIPGKASTASSKFAIYSKHFALAPRNKYTGYEKLRGLDAKFRPLLEEKYGSSLKIFRTPYRRLLRDLAYAQSE